MKATHLEFRLRMLINAAIIVLGFWAPWIEHLGLGSRVPLLEWLALSLSRTGLLRFTVATIAVIVAGSFLAALGAWLRIWGNAWLGASTVVSPSMRAGGVMADGPYRYLRNPLYLGLWCSVLAMALLMPPTGALVTLPLLALFLLRLVLGEEAFLSAQLGEPYRAYCGRVPRLMPRLRSSLPHTGIRPHWLRATLSEPFPLGVFVALAFFSWTYDNRLMLRVILIAFGLSLLTRALLPGDKTADPEARG